MFDLGWQEFLMVAVVLMLVVGPKDLPRILRSFSQLMRKAKSMAHEFTSSLEDVARQEEFKDVKDILYDAKEGNFDEMAKIIGGDIQDAAEDIKASAGLDGIEDDVKEIAGKKAPKASQKKSAKKPAKAKGKTGAKKSAKTGAKTAKKVKAKAST